MIENLRSRTLKGGIAFTVSVALVAAGSNAYQLAADPSDDDPFDTFVLETKATAPSTASSVGIITVQNTTTGDLIMDPAAPSASRWSNRLKS